MAAGDGRPFFGYISFGPPHFPNTMREHDRTLYRPEEIPLPPGVPDPELRTVVQRRRNDEFCGGDPRARHPSHAAWDTKPPGEPETEAEIRQFIAEYYGMITSIDWNVGGILNRLDALGIAGNTMVVFLSDHGDMLGRHGFFCGIKCEAYRAAMQVPLIIRYPERFEAGRRTRALVDVGVDIGIRTREWLHVRHKDRRAMLHDLHSDYHEQNNLMGLTEHSVLMNQFDARIAARMAGTGDDWEMAADFPPPDFLTHAEARTYLETELRPNAIVVPRAGTRPAVMDWAPGHGRAQAAARPSGGRRQRDAARLPFRGPAGWLRVPPCHDSPNRRAGPDPG